MASVRPFRFGIINETTCPPDEWISHVQKLEKLGFDTFLIRDHLVPDFFGPQLAPLSALMAAAMATTRLRVGTLVLDNDFRHPAVLAKEAATIDFLSGGRLELGIGAGWLRREYELAGIAYESAGVRISRMEEAVQVLKSMLAAEICTFNGEHYKIDGLENFPPAAQRPRPPILIGGGKPRMLRLAGRHADIVSILTSSVSSGVLESDPVERLASSVETKLDHIRQGAGERFSEIELNLIPSLILSDDPNGDAQNLIDTRGWVGITVEDVLDMPSVFIGSSEEIIETMRVRRERFGFSYYTFSDSEIDLVLPIVQALRGS